MCIDSRQSIQLCPYHMGLVISNKRVETASLSTQYSVVSTHYSVALNKIVLLLLYISQTFQSLFVIETSQGSRQH